MTTVLNYEVLKADFNRNLVTQLRGHSSGSEYLETWVPDEDPVKSIFGMVEAAMSSGCAEIRIHFAEATMDEIQCAALVAAVNEIAEASLIKATGGYELAIAGVKS